MQTREQQVKAGAELLDRKMGPDWSWSVNTDTLNIASTEDCILGQLHTSALEESAYSVGKRALGIESGDEYGFVGMTTSLWIKEIEARRDASLESVQGAEMMAAGLKTE